MSAKHTAGPWCVGNARRSHRASQLPVAFEAAVHVGASTNRGNCLATVYMGGPGATLSGRDEVETNARLIASAPDLLAALQTLCSMRDMSSDQLTAAWDAARAAIAKATGA